jgi:biotin carboxylase
MFAETAARLGVEVVLATDRCHVLDDPWADHALPIRFEQPEAAAEEISDRVQVDGVVALGDRPAYIAAVAAERLGLKFHPARAVAACRSKYDMRERFRTAGLLVPGFQRIPLGANAEGAAGSAKYPCVLKPLGLSASRGVIRADGPAEFVAAFRRIRRLLEQPELLRVRESQDEFIQVETFIPGVELALEGIMTDGRLETLAVFDKPDPLDGPFFEETLYVTPSRQDAGTQAAILDTTARAATALGLWHGPIHAEIRVNQEGVWMLEVAARPIGGLCARVLPGLTERIVRHAVSEEADNAVLGTPAAGVMMIPIPRGGVYQEVFGVEEAARIPGIEEVVITAKQGQALLPLPEGNSYLGFVFARGEGPAEVESALREAHGCLRFEIATALPVVSG